MKTLACIIARTHSSRLPKKVLRKIGDKMLIEHVIARTKMAKNIDDIYLCTSVDPHDAILLEIAEKNGIKAYAGSKDAPIERMLHVGMNDDVDNLIRITGDNIFCDEIFMDKLIETHKKKK